MECHGIEKELHMAFLYDGVRIAKVKLGIVISDVTHIGNEVWTSDRAALYVAYPAVWKTRLSGRHSREQPEGGIPNQPLFPRTTICGIHFVEQAAVLVNSLEPYLLYAWTRYQ